MKTTMPTTGLNRLVAAAVVSTSFRHLLLTNAAEALDAGYHGTPFQLSPEEIELVLNIQAANLADFATQLLAGSNGRDPSHDNGHNSDHNI